MPEEARDFFTTAEILHIKEAIKEAEKKTSGEIRVHIENTCHNMDTKDRAAQVFADLNMHKTELRNGVLFYLAIKDRKFAILGDIGINQIVSDKFWEEIKNSMQEYFKKKEFTNGLVDGVNKAGEKLVNHFPYQREDVNELSDEISFGAE